MSVSVGRGEENRDSISNDMILCDCCCGHQPPTYNYLCLIPKYVKAKKKTTEAAFKYVRPLMSTDCCEARRRVISLYKAVYRYIPRILKYHDIPKSENDIRLKVRELFYKNACVTDIRVIDLLVIKGWMEFVEIKNQWQMKGHVFANWNPTLEPKPCDFLGKFLTGID